MQKTARKSLNSVKSRLLFLTLLCLYLLLASVTLFAHNNDSLSKVIDSKTLSDKQQLAAYVSLAGSLATKDFDQCIQRANEGIKLASQLKDSVAIGQLYTILGEASYFKGSYDVGTKYLYDAVRILEPRNKALTALAFNNLGKLYRKIKELDKSIQNYDRAMELYSSMNDSAGVQMIWNESGVPFEYMGNYDEALRRYKKSLEIARARKDLLGESYSLANISGALMLQEKYDESVKYMDQCLAMRKVLKDTFSLALTYSDRGSLFIAMGEYEKAKESIEQSNVLANHLKYPGLLAANYQLLSELYGKQGKFEQALEYANKATAMRDSVFNIAKAEQITELNTKYETEKKEQEIALQKIALSRKNYIIGGIGIILLLGIFLGFAVHNRNKLKQEAKLQEEILKQQQLASRAVLEAEEKERQRIGLDLHDGVGQMMSAAKINLSSFLSDIEVPNEEERLRVDNILSLIDESCKEVRAVSHSMMPNALLKAGLASAVREFLNRIDSKVLEVNLYTEGLDERLDTTIETVLYRVIQESVNNVIKHSGASRLDISIIKDEDGLSATIEDNGKGFDTSDASIRNGIGLKNIETRINYLKGEVNIDSSPGHGTVTVINIPPGNLGV